MAAIDAQDVAMVAAAMRKAAGPGTTWETAARDLLEAFADRLVPRTAIHTRVEYHRTAGTGVEYRCMTDGCIVPVTRTEHTVTWSAP